jgi:hypothetical protein
MHCRRRWTDGALLFVSPFVFDLRRNNETPPWSRRRRLISIHGPRRTPNSIRPDATATSSLPSPFWSVSMHTVQYGDAPAGSLLGPARRRRRGRAHLLPSSDWPALTTGRKKGLRPASRCLWLHWQDAGGHYELRTPPHRFFSLESHFNLEKPNFVGFERQLVKLYSYLVNKNLYSYLTSRCLLYDMIDFVVIEA